MMPKHRKGDANTAYASIAFALFITAMLLLFAASLKCSHEAAKRLDAMEARR